MTSQWLKATGLRLFRQVMCTFLGTRTMLDIFHAAGIIHSDKAIENIVRKRSLTLRCLRFLIVSCSILISLTVDDCMTIEFVLVIEIEKFRKAFHLNAYLLRIKCVCVCVCQNVSVHRPKLWKY